MSWLFIHMACIYHEYTYPYILNKTLDGEIQLGQYRACRSHDTTSNIWPGHTTRLFWIRLLVMAGWVTIHEYNWCNSVISVVCQLIFSPRCRIVGRTWSCKRFGNWTKTEVEIWRWKIWEVYTVRRSIQSIWAVNGAKTRSWPSGSAHSVVQEIRSQAK